MEQDYQAKEQIANATGIMGEVEEPTLEKEIVAFRLLPENAIPIPPTIGARFKAFYEDNLKRMKEIYPNWTIAIEEYQKTGEYAQSKNGTVPQENFIRTTVDSLVDYTYMRNPQAEFTAYEDDAKDLANVLTKATQTLINKRAFPGINLRPKIAKQIVYAHLTNFGIIKIDYQPAKGSIEQVLKVSELAKAKIKEETDPEKAGKLYELLDILQRELDVRKNIGISVTNVSPFALIVGPESSEYDLSQNKIIMYRELLDTDHIKAEYTTFEENSAVYKYKYNPEVTLAFDAGKASTSVSTAEQIINELMPDMDDTQARIHAKNKTPCVWVYDRTTRLIFLYIEGGWDTPLWVFEDEMKLSRFFPFFVLGFANPLQSIVQDGEVSLYIAHQHQINEINAQTAVVRKAAFNTYLYNSSGIAKEEVEKVFKEITNHDGRMKAIGIKLKDSDIKLEDILAPLKVPTANFAEIFNKDELLKGLDRATRISDAQRGAQFRTNTTNDAIQVYNEYASNRIEGFTDQIEDTVEQILWAVAELVISKMSNSDVSKLLSTKEASLFKSMSVEDFNQRYNVTIAAGSTEKPTSTSKKKEAVQIMQLLGQFGTAAPRTVLTLVTRLLRSAFNRALVTDDDIEKLEQEGIANMQKGVSTQQAPQAGQPPMPQQPQPQTLKGQ